MVVIVQGTDEVAGIVRRDGLMGKTISPEEETVSYGRRVDA
jgi:hypothetical protein